MKLHVYTQVATVQSKMQNIPDAPEGPLMPLSRQDPPDWPMITISKCWELLRLERWQKMLQTKGKTRSQELTPHSMERLRHHSEKGACLPLQWDVRDPVSYFSLLHPAESGAPCRPSINRPSINSWCLEWILMASEWVLVNLWMAPEGTNAGSEGTLTLNFVIWNARLLSLPRSFIQASLFKRVAIEEMLSL